MKLKGFAGLSGAFVLASLVILASSCEFGNFLQDLFSGKQHTPDYANQFPAQPMIFNNSYDNTVNNAQQWNRINNAQAEKGCLKQAKKVAVDKGYPSAVILSCKCTSEESISSKVYKCKVTTADLLSPNRNVDITCIKSGNRCIVISEGQTYVYTFDELEKFANG